ncbi:hypothetical protein AB6A40_003829 [Gnathostoma spinigerum]|uniref:DNA-directed RNA polymerase n=1 Tax=Gnathostoma spinigerum TaxID=75299 RepID=A0ABD6EAQ4_9BILA
MLAMLWYYQTHVLALLRHGGNFPTSRIFTCLSEAVLATSNLCFVLDLSHGERSCSTVFMTDPNRPCKSISPDGLPIEGRLYADGDPYYSTLDLETGLYRIHKYDHTERAFCGLVRIIETTGNIGGKFCALIQWRFQRNPIIGDKFASRHGQKGINSFLWPTESLPFSEGGMVPDIIFNPHGFPSRMTIGMMIESMAGKSAAVNGMTYDASPFVFNEKKTAIEYFGKLLTLAGYNYYGNETMYSGVDGREMEAQIFFGIVYYQRLRHMIADKYQVRSTGPCDPVTKQPVKGRKKGGGIRFGEMERDAMIAHGATFCLQDRLFNCSDRDTSYICKKCGSLISVFKAAKAFIRNERGDNTELCDKSEVQFCHSCRSEKDVEIIQIPHVFSYLVAELAAMNVRTVLSVKSLNDCR